MFEYFSFRRQLRPASSAVVLSFMLAACGNSETEADIKSNKAPAPDVNVPSAVEQPLTLAATESDDVAERASVSGITISPNLPISETVTPPKTIESIQHGFDVFSWESFIALNWPADKNGEADKSVTIGQKPGAMTVWQSYKESRDIFLPQGATPPGWNEPVMPPSECDAQDHKPVLVQVGKTLNVLDESGEPFKTGPLIDQHGQYTRYEILTNKIMFDYILDKGLYSKAGQAAFGKAANFPISQNPSTDSNDKTTQDKSGSILVKAAWMVMNEEHDQSKFHISQAYVYNNPSENAGVQPACELETVGLVGLHIATKVDGSPQWAWSTFEHIDNAPTQGETPSKDRYNYYKVDCDDCTAVNTPPDRPWDPAIPFTKPSQIERVIPIDAATKALNDQYHYALNAAVPGSVWANYELISTQWPSNATSTTDPTGAPAPAFLANTTLETYIQGSVRQTSSSCIQCHNNATETNGLFSDFTYLLQRAQ